MKVGNGNSLSAYYLQRNLEKLVDQWEEFVSDVQN